MRINTNISAVIANKNLQSAQNKVSSSLEKLSSGFKINHAADDAAGMAIAAKLRSQIRGLEQSSQNASDGISVVQTAEGALAEVENMLQRIRELSVQAANGIYVDEDRDALQAEVDNLLAEVDRISNDTEFNKKPLLDGSLDRRSYTNQDGIRVSYASPAVPADKYEITITKMGTQAEINGNPIALAAGDVITKDQAGVIKINDYDININAGDTTEEVYAKITEAADRLNLTVEGFTAGELSFRTYEYGSNERITFDISNAELATALGLQTSYDVAGTNVEANFGGAREGFTETATMYCYGNSVTVTDLGGFKLEYEVEEDYADVGNPVTAEVTDIGTMTIHIGANEGQVLDIRVQEVSRRRLGLENLNLRTTTGASKALSRLDDAIQMISQVRSELGACQNRLDAATSSLDVTTENMHSAISRIEDVDMAEEMATYTQNNVLSQAGVSMVAQANELPQMVLQLLQ